MVWLAPAIYLVIALASGWVALSLLPPSFPIPPDVTGGVGVYLSDPSVHADLHVIIMDTDNGPIPEIHLSLASSSPETVKWAVLFTGNAVFGDPRDPAYFPGSTALFAIHGGSMTTVSTGPQLARGTNDLTAKSVEVTVITGDVVGPYVATTGSTFTAGSKFLLALPAYGSNPDEDPYFADAESEYPDITYTTHPTSIHVSLDAGLDVAPQYLRVDTASTNLTKTDTGLSWVSDGPLASIRLGYVDIAKEADEQSHLFIAGVLLGLAGGALLGFGQALLDAIEDFVSPYRPPRPDVPRRPRRGMQWRRRRTRT